MPLFSLQKLRALTGPRPRTRDHEGGRALVEFRDVTVDGLQAFSSRLKELAAQRPEIEWVEVNPFLRRAVFALNEGFRSSDVQLLSELEALVREAERTGPSWGEPLPTSSELPDDELLLLQRWVEMAADSAGLGLGLMFRLVPFVPATLGANATFLLWVLQTQPLIRKRFDARFGKERTDLFINVATSFAQAVSQRPVGSLVDVGYRVSVLRELRARSRSFARHRSTLLAHAQGFDLSPSAVAPPRERRPPQGAFENYTAKMWLPAGSAFTASLLASRSPSRAISAMFAALPKPASLGRAIFANELGRALAERGALVLEPDALMRLERIDCLVLDGRLLSQVRFRVARVEAIGEAEELIKLRARVRGMFAPQRAVEVQTRGGFRLGPPALLGVELDDQTRALAQELSDQGSLVLALAENDAPRALVEITIRKSSGVEELLRVVEHGGMRVVIATDDPDGLADAASRYEVVEGGAHLSESIKRLRREGRAVALIHDGPSTALPVADCSIGILRSDKAPPFGAHILSGPSMDELRMLVHACLVSRGVSKQSVNLAMGATAIGTLISAGAQGSVGRKVMFAVNVTTVVAMINALQKSAPLHDRARELLPDPTPWHALEAGGVMKRLESGPGGLTETTAIERTQTHQRKQNALVELGRAVSEEFWNPLAPLLAAGAGMSALVGSRLDAGIVASVAGVNAFVGGTQRFRTERAIRRLVRPQEQHVRAIRNGHPRMLFAADLVVGDVIELSAGDVVPADCRLIRAENLEVDSASLTGESLPSHKSTAASFEANISDRRCMLYAGTTIVGGHAQAIAVAVGPLVEAQRSALSQNALGQSALGHTKDAQNASSGVEARIRELMSLTGPVAAVGGLAVMAAGILRGRRAQEVVSSAVSMAVAAVPEGLPVLASAAQLSAAQRLSKKGALVRNPQCIEALGRVDLICLDKTGTLTTGHVELELISDGERTQALSELDVAGRRVLSAALRASKSAYQDARGRDATDAALDRAGSAQNVRANDEVPGFRVLVEHRFESARGFHAVIGTRGDHALISLKGSPEQVLARCSERQRDGQARELDAQARAALLEHAAQLASEGLRVLAVAERVLETSHEAAATLTAGDLNACRFVGLLVFRDPPRATAKRTIERLRATGIEAVMLTGDHQNTAQSIAREVGLLGDRSVMTGGELASLSDEELDRRIASVAVFARVTPSQKVRIVRSLQRAGRVTAMVGDGANDAPALRVAAVGIAVGEHCAPAARASADIVFTEASIDSLIDGVIEARAMWPSVRDAVSILLGGNLGEIGFTAIGGLVSGRSPVNARQLLLINLLTDVAPAMAIALRRPSPSEYEALAQRLPTETLGADLDRDILVRAASTALGGTWAWGLGRLTGSRKRASTIALASLVGSQLGQTLLSRGGGTRVVWTSVGSWAALVAIVQTPGLSQVFGCRPMGPVGWTIALGSSAAATATSAGLTALHRYLLPPKSEA